MLLATPRRAMIEALIGHMKVDGLKCRDWKGTSGEVTHLTLCWVQQKLDLLLRAIADFLRLKEQTLLVWLRSLWWSSTNPWLTQNPE